MASRSMAWGTHRPASTAVILSKSTRHGYDVNYLFGQVDIDQAFVDGSGNCGKLSAAVGSYAVRMGLIDADG